jgi:cytochrome c oxidase subunit II
VDNTSLPPQGAETRPRRRWLRLVALPVAAVALAGCQVPTFGVKPGVTKTSKATFHLWQGFTVAALIIGGIAFALMFWAVVRYRRKSPTAIPRQTQYHIPLEMIYTVVPILVVIGLFVATVVVENKVIANPPNATVVNVDAFQWGWKFSYPGQDVTVVGQTTQTPTMVIPVDTNVHVNLTSTDVVHGFYVRSFNFSRYALPGVTNQFTFDAVSTGTYFGQCTQLCGLYHSLMFFQVKVVPQAEYQSWLAANKNATAAQAAASATALQTSSGGVSSKNTTTNFLGGK